jgi:drug/metabolite transporter (DMT)-like permease
MIDVHFWLPIVLIIVVGTIGGLLFKYGTNAFGSISLERMLEIQFSSKTFLYLGMMLVGTLLIFFSGYSLRDHFFAMRFLFSPLIFCALVALFISRLLIGVPLSVTGLGRFTMILMTLSAVATVIASAIVFKESYPPRVALGIVLGIAAVALIGEA